MRISDWSSDVCSSDLQHLEVFSLNFEASKALKSHRNGFRVDSRNDQVASFSGLNRFRRGDCVTNFAEDDHVGIASHECLDRPGKIQADRSEEHTSELQSLMRISYAVFCLKKKKYPKTT